MADQVSEHPDVALPAAMVEAAARALAEHDVELLDRSIWDELSDEDQDEYREAARRGLTAALGMCEVREVWQVHFVAKSGNPAEDVYERNPPFPHPKYAREHARRTDYAAGFDAIIERAFVLTTPAEPVDPTAEQP